MTDRTQPEAREFTMSQYASKDDMIGAMRKRIAELESELEAVGAGGVSGPLMGRASLSANAGEPVAWQYRSLRDNGAWFDCTKERFEMRCTQPEIWETRALYAAQPTAQAEGWQSIETAPKEGVFLVFMQDEVRPARRMQVANWHPNVKLVGGLFAFDCAKVTHWMPLPNPPTSAEGVEHG